MLSRRVDLPDDWGKDHSNAINKLIFTMKDQREPGDALPDILQNVIEYMNAQAGTIYIEEDGSFWFAWSENVITSSVWNNLYPGLKVPISKDSLAGYTAYHNKELWIPNVHQDLSKYGCTFDAMFDLQSGFRTENSYTLPLTSEENTVAGVIQILNIKNLDMPFMRKAAVLAAVEVERIRRIRKDTLRILRVAALRDPKETAAHVQRVGDLSILLRTQYGEMLGESKKSLIRARNNLFYAAMLHDIGKVGIPDSILKKPGKLTPDERLVIEEHPRMGWELFRDSFRTELDVESRNVILHHHQRWDGKGYPRDEPRAGTDIPLEARIVAIVDVWDALTNERCYKEGYSRERSRQILLEGRGTQFDPELLDFFLKLEKKRAF